MIKQSEHQVKQISKALKEKGGVVFSRVKTWRVWSLITHYKKTSIILAVVFMIGALVLVNDRSVAEELATPPKRIEVVSMEELASQSTELPLVGILQANQQLDLRPQLGGLVSAVNVKVDQEVQAGDILVEVSHADLDAAVAQAQASVASASAQLQKLRNGSRPEEVLILEQQLAAAKRQLSDMQNGSTANQLELSDTRVINAQKSLEESQKNYDTMKQLAAAQLANAEQSKKEAELNLANAKLRAETDLINAYRSLQNSLNDALVKADNSVNGPLSALYGRDYGNLDDLIFTSGNVYDKDRAEVLYADAKSAVREISISLNNFNGDNTELVALVDTTINKLSIIRTYLYHLSRAIDEEINLENDSLHRTNVASARTTLEAATSAITSSRDAIRSVETQSSTSISTAEAALDRADVTLALQKAESDRTILAAQSQLTQAENALSNEQGQQNITQNSASSQVDIQKAQVAQIEQQLEIAKNGARVEDIRLQQASVAQAQASLALAIANREKALVRAPIAGKVTFVDLKIGDVVSSQQIVASLANQGGLEVETYVTENERSSIEVGAAVKINDEFDGVVREIAPALDPINKKVKVLVTVTSEEVNTTLGETVRLLIAKTKSTEATVLLPISAVKLRASGAQIFSVSTDNTISAIDVQTGAVDGKQIEIISELNGIDTIAKDARGLKDGQTIEVK